MNTETPTDTGRITFYRIRDWQRHFENNRTREMEKMRWVPVPNKHDGEGFQRIMQQKDGIVIYGCWHLILQVASKLRERGTLLRDDGTPITADTLALKTGWRRPQDFQRTLDFCSSAEMDWIERLSIEGAEKPQATAEKPQEGARNGMEWKGMEGKGREEDTAESETIKTQWNALAERAGLPSIQLVTPERLKKYRLRLAAFPDLWDTLSKQIPRLSAFARGKQEGSSWRLSFDFCVESDGNFLKLKEGKYARPERMDQPI